MKLAEQLEKYQEAFLRLLYPSLCGVCHHLLEIEEKGICQSCHGQLQRLRLTPAQRMIHQKFNYLDEAWVLYPYESPAKEILTGVKFQKKRWLLHLFAEELKAWTLALSSEIFYHALIPIPLAKSKLLERQFNQSELIASMISKETHLPMEKDLLGKRWETPVQSRLTRDERQTNLSYAFRVRHPKKTDGKSFLLIDDIFTTGATAEEAARGLKVCGAKRVDVLALAYTGKEGIRS